MAYKICLKYNVKDKYCDKIYDFKWVTSIFMWKRGFEILKIFQFIFLINYFFFYRTKGRHSTQLWYISLMVQHDMKYWNFKDTIHVPTSWWFPLKITGSGDFSITLTFRLLVSVSNQKGRKCHLYCPKNPKYAKYVMTTKKVL